MHNFLTGADKVNNQTVDVCWSILHSKSLLRII